MLNCARVSGSSSRIAFAEYSRPLEVFIEPKNIPAIEPDALEDAVAIEQAVIEHGHLGLGLIHKFTVEVDFHFRPR